MVPAQEEAEVSRAESFLPVEPAPAKQANEPPPAEPSVPTAVGGTAVRPGDQAPSLSHAEHGDVCPAASQSGNRRRVRWILWAELMKRSLGLDALTCPECGGRMVIIAAILEAEVIAKILRCLEEKHLEVPAMRPVRAPPEVVRGDEERLIELDMNDSW